MLREATGSVIGKSKLYPIRIQFRYELHNIEDADSLIGLPIRQFVTLFSASRADTFCLFGCHRYDKFFAGIRSMPLLRSDTETHYVPTEMRSINSQFSREKSQWHELVR